MTTRFLHFPSTGRSGGLGSFYILVLGSCLAGNHGHSPSPSRSRRAHPPRGTCLEAVPCVRSPGVCAQQSVLAPASLPCRNQGMRPPRVASFLLGQKSQQHGPWLGSMLIGSAGTFLTISCPLHLPCPGSVIWTLLLSPPPFAASSVPDSPPIPLPPL